MNSSANDLTLPNPWIDPAIATEIFECGRKLGQTEALLGEEVTHADFQDPHHGMYPIHPDHRFVLDKDRFLADIEESPAFLRAPRPEYLAAADMIPVLAVLAGH